MVKEDISKNKGRGRPGTEHASCVFSQFKKRKIRWACPIDRWLSPNLSQSLLNSLHIVFCRSRSWWSRRSRRRSRARETQKGSRGWWWKIETYPFFVVCKFNVQSIIVAVLQAANYDYRNTFIVVCQRTIYYYYTCIELNHHHPTSGMPAITSLVQMYDFDIQDMRLRQNLFSSFFQHPRHCESVKSKNCQGRNGKKIF
jgi:hypothetical protein